MVRQGGNDDVKATRLHHHHLPQALYSFLLTTIPLLVRCGGNNDSAINPRIYFTTTPYIHDEGAQAVMQDHMIAQTHDSYLECVGCGQLKT